jgi:hypothetical protein
VFHAQVFVAVASSNGRMPWVIIMHVTVTVTVTVTVQSLADIVLHGHGHHILILATYKEGR